MAAYDHQIIQQKWQKRWDDERRYQTDTSAKNPVYVLDMFPYPSGEGLHVGHPLGYIGSDILTRYLRAQGKSVLHPMGWDAFGLPAENYAIKSGVHPAETTRKAIDRYRGQLKMIGLAYDWQREIATCDPAYYKWTQWLFLELYQRGLAYRKTAPVNWCPKDQTVLANEQVKDGRCERCDSQVEQRELAQWFFKITEFAEQLLSDIEQLDWPEPIKAMQRNWIGKSEGAELAFQIPNAKCQILVYTTRPDTLFGATYLVLSPEHAFVTQQLKSQKSPTESDTHRSHRTKVKNIDEVQKYVEQAQRKTELERKSDEKEKTGVELQGVQAINPATGKEIPIWIADYVLGSYGTGAIMAVPAHDERDYAFAQKFDLPIKRVIEPVLMQTTDSSAFRIDEPFVDSYGVIVVLKHWKDDTYLGLKWRDASDWGTLLTGGLDEGITPEETVLKEIREETGYKHAKIVKQLGVIHSKYYHVPKKANRFGHAPTFLVELLDSERDEISEEESTRHELHWLSAQELRTFLTATSHKLALAMFESGVYTGEGVLSNSMTYSGMSSSEARDVIAATFGTPKVQYRLRDWLVSRQRYWGAPIPIIYCTTCAQDNREVRSQKSEVRMTTIDDIKYAIVPVPLEQLPVELPTDVDFKPTGQSPLVDSKNFNTEVTCPNCGSPARREVDTMDTFVDSSWYYLRYVNPDLTSLPFVKDDVRRWLPIDWYVGGAEHAVLHLLYARFITKVLHDGGYLTFPEPFSRLRNQGLILGEDQRKMSKRWGNVVNPDDVVRDYGADALRCFEMFMGPFEDSKPWSIHGLIGVRRWLERVWKLEKKVVNTAPASVSATRALDQAINRVSEMITSFHFNTAISQLMILTNTLEKEESITPKDWQHFLQILTPFAPHISHELWRRAGLAGYPDDTRWPVPANDTPNDEQTTIAILVNGRVRGELRISSHLPAEELTAAAKKIPNVARYLSEKKLAKEPIIVPGRLINFVVE